MPQHQHKQSTMNEMLTPAPKASAPNLNSVFSSNAGLLLDSTLSRWCTRNAVHRLLDEGDSRIRQEHAQHNLPILHRLAFNLLRSEKAAPKSALQPNANEPVGKLTIL